eukprot:3717780-Lingulodinium_polyedra.AAC.1
MCIRDRARYRDCGFWLPASDDAAGMWLKPHCGGLIGDPYMVKSFVGTFREPVEEWVRDCKDISRGEEELYMGADRIMQKEGPRVYVGLFKFADDLKKLVVAEEGGGAKELARLAGSMDDRLDERLSTRGFRQNRGKQEG